MMRLRNWLAATLLLVLTALAQPVLAAGDRPFVMLEVLTVNDFHGRLTPQGDQPGAAALVGTLRKLQENNPQGTLVLSAGDMLSGTVEADWLEGQPVLAVMQRANVAAMALGNHEFNLPAERLAKQAQTIPFLAANLFDKATGQRPAFVKPYVIVERSGVRIGVIGLATPESAFKAHPREVGRYRFSDPIDSARQAIEELRGKTDVIILLTHLGSDINADGKLVGEAVPLAQQAGALGVAAVVTGHSHKQVAIEAYGVPVVQAGAHGTTVGKVSLLYSRLEKKVVSSGAGLVTVVSAGYPADDKTAELVASASRQAAVVQSEVLTTAAPALTHDRWQLSPMGCYAADVLRAAFKADVAFVNGGALRDNLPGGRVTAGDLHRVLPFRDNVETGRMTGRAIRELLEYGLFNTKVGVLQFSGLKVQTDATRPLGGKIQRLTLADGSELHDGAWYKVAANSFLAAGGDQYTWFSGMNERQEWQAQLKDVVAIGLRSASLPAGTPQERWLQR